MDWHAESKISPVVGVRMVDRVAAVISPIGTHAVNDHRVIGRGEKKRAPRVGIARHFCNVVGNEIVEASRKTTGCPAVQFQAHSC